MKKLLVVLLFPFLLASNSHATKMNLYTMGGSFLLAGTTVYAHQLKKSVEYLSKKDDLDQVDSKEKSVKNLCKAYGYRVPAVFGSAMLITGMIGLMLIKQGLSS